MNTKRKLIISISSLAIVILAVVVTVVAVLAAQHVAIKSSVNVKYTAVRVKGTVTASHQVLNSSVVEIGSIPYTGDEEGEVEDSLNASEIVINNLTSTNKSVEFTFTFTNEGPAPYTASLTLPSTITNFSVIYTVPNTNGATKISDTSFTIAENTTTAVEYKIKFEITDTSENAEIKGDFNWYLGQ